MAGTINKFETVACNFDKPTDDEKWINNILKYLITFYCKHKNNTNFHNKTENQITEAIQVLKIISIIQTNQKAKKKTEHFLMMGECIVSYQINMPKIKCLAE